MKLTEALFSSFFIRRKGKSQFDCRTVISKGIGEGKVIVSIYSSEWRVFDLLFSCGS